MYIQFGEENNNLSHSTIFSHQRFFRNYLFNKKNNRSWKKTTKLFTTRPRSGFNLLCAETSNNSNFIELYIIYIFVIFVVLNIDALNKRTTGSAY